MHKLLERQLKKRFGSIAQVPPELADFVAAVGQAYEQADADRQLLERSLDLTSDELLEANAALRLDREELEKRVAERTAELLAVNRSLEREISERQAVEDRLRASEQRFQALAEHSPTGIFHADEAGRTVYVNRAWCEIAGLGPEEALGEEWQRALHPGDRERLVTQWRDAVAVGGTVQAGEYRMLRPDGSECWVVGQAVPLLSDRGQVAGYVGTVADITERRKAEEAIRTSEQKYRRLFEESRDTIYIATPEGRMLDINPAGVRMFGYPSREEMLEVDLGEQIYLRPEDRTRMLQSLTVRGFVEDLELEVRTKDGRRLTVLASASADRDQRGRVVAVRGLMRDVTGQRDLERQLRQAQKMEAVGRLAGGVAHDFNNLLTAIIGYSDLLAMAVPDDSPLRRHTDEIKAAAKRGADLTRQLLAFGRRQVLALETLDLNRSVSAIEKLLRRVIGEDIELISELDAELGAVQADPNQIEQVLLNLGINARDAMPEGGVLTLRTANIAFDAEATAAPAGLEPGSYVLLEVEDTGVGIPETIRDQIFEPFFTTKPRGKGSGLGLSTVYGIVRQSGGQIVVDSSRGRGSRFRIFLPRVTEEQPPSSEPRETVTGLPGGSETVFLVEDEPAVRDFLRGLLERLGYSVLTASDGEEALEVAARSERPIDLLLSDVVMPRMNGVELARRLAYARPGLRVLLMSGYTEKPEPLADDAPGAGDIDFLHKPFSSGALAQRLRELLEPRLEANRDAAGLGRS